MTTATAVPTWSRVLRVIGWVLITSGVVVLLYVAYALVFTNAAAHSAQDELLREWNLEIGDVVPGGPLAGESQEVDGAPAEPVEAGEAVAVLQFRRPGAEAPIVHADPLFVVEGVTPAALQRGPGHYPATALPGAPGNFAVAGHRTTYGAPFFHLDQIVEGDEVLVTGRDGRRYTYTVSEVVVVRPEDSWVLAPDPLQTGRPTLTLTTCHPRFSNAERLIVFAELEA